MRIDCGIGIGLGLVGLGGEDTTSSRSSNIDNIGNDTNSQDTSYQDISDEDGANSY